MSEPITMEDVQQEYKDNPQATPLEHVANLLEKSDDKEQEEGEK